MTGTGIPMTRPRMPERPPRAPTRATGRTRRGRARPALALALLLAGAVLCGFGLWQMRQAPAPASADRTPPLASVALPTAGAPRRIFDIGHMQRMATTPIGRDLVSALTSLLIFEDIDSWNGASHLCGWAIGWRLTGDAKLRDQAAKMLDDLINDRYATMQQADDHLWTHDTNALDLSKVVMGMALAHELIAADLPVELRRRWTRELDARAKRLAKGGGPGWNPSPESNWNALARSAAGVAALVLHGSPDAPWASSATAADDCRRKVGEYLASLGSAGWNQEGDRYLRFASINGWMPFAAAWQRYRGEDMLAGTNARAYVDQLVAKCTWSHADKGLVMPQFGKRDGTAELSSMFSGDFTLAMGMADASQRAQLLWTMQRLLAPPRDHAWGLRDPHQIALALAFIDGAPAQSPQGRRPTVLYDTTHGYLLARNRWRDDHDVVVAVNAAASKIRRCWWFDEPGSLKLNGLGARWLAKADESDGLPTGDRARDNAVVVPGREALGPGRVLREQRWDDGSFLLDMDLSQVYAEPPTMKGGQPTPWPMRRQVCADLSGAGAMAAVIVVLDQVDASVPATALWQVPAGAVAEDAAHWRASRDSGTMQVWHLSPGASVAVTAKVVRTDFVGRLLSVIALAPATAALTPPQWKAGPGGDGELSVGSRRWRIAAGTVNAIR